MEIESLEKQILKEKYKRIYNDYYDGVIKSAEMFEQMSSECNERIERFSEKKQKLSEELSRSEIKSDNVGKFISLIKRFSNVEELTPEILNTLVSAIEVGEKVYDAPNHTTQNVSVNYKFISRFC